VRLALSLLRRSLRVIRVPPELQEAFCLCAEHVRQLGGESPLPSLVEVKG
jgi:hypothetical protein